jgi:hypothetical protein
MADHSQCQQTDIGSLDSASILLRSSSSTQVSHSGGIVNLPEVAKGIPES